MQEIFNFMLARLACLATLLRIAYGQTKPNQTMTYYESAEDITISRSRAIQELQAHGLPLEEYPLFFADLGDQKEYEAQAVLAWLGY